MKCNSGIVKAVVVALAAVVVGAGAWLVFRDGTEHAGGQEHAVRSHKMNIASSKGTLRRADVRTRVAKGRSAKQINAKNVRLIKPNFSKELEAESVLTDKMKQIFAELQNALDNNDKKKVFSVIHKLQAMEEWPDDIPKSIKLRALDAIAWFGSHGFAEAVGFLVDSDQEVVETAIEKFEDMLMDSSELGDVGVSEILKQIVKVVHDTDALDMFFMELDNMRPTVKAQTALAILDSGNPEAVSVLKDNLDFLFLNEIDKDGIEREDISQYYKDAEKVYMDNPEKAAEDEEFYGPSKTD